VEFFAASMSLDLSNTDKLAVFYQDGRRMGVKIRAPDVNRSGADFEVEDGEVLYALGAVRNVGLEAMKHLVAVREEGGRFRDLFDLVERVDPRQVNKRALENLARAGAFDSLHPNRAQIVDNADALIAYGQSMAAERASSQTSLFGGEQVEAGRPRLNAREPWTATEQLDEELAAVGFYLTGHPLEGMLEMLRRRRTTLLTDALAQAEAGAEAFRMAGVVRRRQERASARTGEKFAFVSLSDPTGEYEVMFPPESLRRCREALEPGRSVSIRVRAKASEGEVRFFGDDAEPLDKAIESISASIRVYLSSASADMEALKKRLQPAGGGPSGPSGEVVLVAGMGAGREVEIKLPGRFMLDSAVRGALKTAPGVSYLEEV
jgi:DNA polymerase-3 subunit alpha